MYDQMIPWDPRLARETPLIRKYMVPGTLLDLACASGRHSLALEDNWQCFGVDYSEEMIAIANELKQERQSPSNFYQADITAPDFITTLRSYGAPKYFDNAILLGNAIANLGTREGGEKFVHNLFGVMRPGARIISQTVYRPSKPFYMPLRKNEGVVVQRIMVPVINEVHNVDLHVNQIDLEAGEYVKKAADNHFFMYTREEYQQLFEQAGFAIKHVFSTYNEGEPKDEDGETLVWVFEKPEILLEDVSLEFLKGYAGFDKEKILSNLSEIWQDTYLVNHYRCIRDARYLYPRITSHPGYETISKDLKGKWIMDIGCNIGTDIRKMVLDGAESEKTIGVDIDKAYFELGYQFYEDEDRLKTKFLVKDLTELGQSLDQKLDIVHAGSLLHLLTDEQNRTLVKFIYEHLNSSGVFFGRALGRKDPENSSEAMLKHFHSVESLTKRLEAVGFVDVTIHTMPQNNAPVGEKSTADKLFLMFSARKP